MVLYKELVLLREERLFYVIWYNVLLRFTFQSPLVVVQYDLQTTGICCFHYKKVQLVVDLQTGWKIEPS